MVFGFLDSAVGTNKWSKPSFISASNFSSSNLAATL
jgi:hypothetical protein